MQPVLAQHEILGLIASGGMADVWLARLRGPAGFEKLVAVKTVRAQLAADPEFREMFVNEARLAAGLNHPNCVQIFQLGEENGNYFLTMEFVNGFSLSRVFHRCDERGAVMPVDVAARVVMDVASGLDHAHHLCRADGQPLHLVHRDVTPGNILISMAGQTKVVDFGIAKAVALTDRGENTRAGQVKGKFKYMAPEYLRGDPIDGRADLFALGLVFYRALTGRHPFDAPTEALNARLILDAEPIAPRTLNRNVPPALEAVLSKALRKAPGERYQTAGAMREAIEDALGTTPGVEAVERFMESLWPTGDTERETLRRLAVGDVSTLSAPVAQTVVGSRSQSFTVTEPGRPSRQQQDQQDAFGPTTVRAIGDNAAMAKLMCPKCRKEPMKAETFEGVEIDRCPVCKGMFFDKGELEEMLVRGEGNTADTLGFSAVSDAMDQIRAHCPRCLQDMQAVTGPADVRIDICNRCSGVFLDQGEFATLQLAKSEI